MRNALFSSNSDKASVDLKFSTNQNREITVEISPLVLLLVIDFVCFSVNAEPSLADTNCIQSRHSLGRFKAVDQARPSD